MPRISVVVLSYNRAAHLALCLRALQRQIFRDFEVIVTDAGSTENNVELALATDNLHLKVTGHEHKYANGGKDASHGVHQCSKTANMGLMLAEGEIIQFVQHDHILSPTYLLHLANLFTFMPPPLHSAIIVGYCHYLKDEVTAAHVDMLAEMDTFGIPPEPGKAEWPLYPRYERFMGAGMQTLLRCPDWRGIDGFDCAVRRSYCLPFDEEFEGQGHEHMDWVYRQVKNVGSTFWCSPLLQHYHQPHREVREKAQWEKELEISTALFNQKHGEQAWRTPAG